MGGIFARRAISDKAARQRTVQSLQVEFGRWGNHQRIIERGAPQTATPLDAAPPPRRFDEDLTDRPRGGPEEMPAVNQ